MLDAFLQNPFAYTAGVLSFITFFASIYLQRNKASSNDVSGYIKELEKKVTALQQTDMDHQRELNMKEIMIGQWRFKTQALEQRLNKDEELKEVLETLVDADTAILAKLEGAEITDESK